MKIVALLSWYDETPAWLAATVASVAPLVDDVVAVDGAYCLYPNGKGSSDPMQAQTILETAAACGIGATVYTPQCVWGGNEVEKRSHLFAMAEQLTVETDWYFPIDADEVLKFASPHVRPMLEETQLDVAEISLNDKMKVDTDLARQMDWPEYESHKHPQLFRALRGLHVDTAHFHYVADGRYLWGPPGKMETALDLSQEIKVEHRNHLRSVARDNARRTYYQRREQLGVERCAA